MKLQMAYANVSVTDIEKAATFYPDVLGWTLRRRDEGFGDSQFDAGPITLGVAVVKPEADNFAELVGGRTGIAFGAEEIDSVFEELKHNGVHFAMEPADQPWGGRLALCADPDGNGFYLDQITGNH